MFDGAPVVVDPSEIRTNGARVIDFLVVQTELPSGTVQLTGVSWLPARIVKVRDCPGPGATARLTARSLTLTGASGVNELTSFSFELGFSCPEGARNQM